MSERPSRSFWILAAFLVLLFLTGGSSRADVQSLQVIRPAATLLAAYGLFTASVAEWRRHLPLALILGAVVLLVTAHLVPVPPDIWQKLPGRSLLTQIDSFAGIQPPWRPLSMVPSATLNALYALSVPIATLALAIQLGKADHVRVLYLLTFLAIFSGLVGLLQATGAKIQFYALSSENGGLFANRNHQGVLLAMIFPMLAIAASSSESLRLRRQLVAVFAGGLALVAVALVIVTGSRAGLLISLLAILLVPVVLRMHKIKPSRSPTPRKAVPRAASIGLAAILIATIVAVAALTSRGVAVARLGESGGDLRWPVWASIIDMLPVYLPWGSGVGTYATVYQVFEPSHLLRPTFSNHAHNEWLEIGLTAGLPGLAIATWAIVLFLRASWCSVRASGPGGVLSRLGVSMIVMLGIASTFDYPVRTPIMSSVLAIAAVWAIAYRTFGNEDGRR